MAKTSTIAWRRWASWIMASVLVVSLAAWYFTRDTLPPTIGIGTAVPGGLYHELGGHLDELLESRTGHEVQLLETRGSKENCERLRLPHAVRELDQQDPTQDHSVLGQTGSGHEVGASP